VNINEDLTVPRYQLNPATFFPGEDGMLGDGVDIQPFNNFLQQQTSLSVKGTSLWLTPDVLFAETPTFSYYSYGDSLVISLKLTNTGDASLIAPFYISAYKDASIVGNKITTDSCMTVLNVTDTLGFTLTIRNLSTHQPLDNIIIQINDKGGAVYIQKECDTTNNTLTVPLSSLLLAHHDHYAATCEVMPVMINVLENDSLPANCTNPEVSIISKSAHVTADIVNNEIEYSGQSTFDTVIYQVVCGSDTSTAAVYITVSASDSNSAFVDDVWYFGGNVDVTTGKSPGIRFVKNEFGKYEPHDASEEANVSSSENALVVSSPYCDGQTIFYSSHNQLYNSLHDTMLNGAFAGNSSVADGLAACYMGDNKYLFFSITREYANPKALKAYVVDMNANNGKGARTTEISVQPEAYAMSESLELIAKAGTTNEYWLVHVYCTSSCNGQSSNVLRVRSVNVTDPDNPVIDNSVHQEIAKTSTDYSFTMKVSPQQNCLALIHSYGYLDVFKFDNSTGKLSERRSVNTSLNNAYGLEFSPDGNQIYIGSWDTPSLLRQYDISGGSITKVGSDIKYGTTRGGGLKLGPDGNIYVMRYGSNQVGVISDPNNALTPLADRYGAFPLSVTYGGLQFSTGLTKPAIMPCNMNTPPTTQPDSTSFCLSTNSRTATVNVLINDTDADPNDTIYLTDAHFVDPDDATLADLTINAVDSTITLTVKPSASISTIHTFEIMYNVKDNGLPASQCATGLLKVTVYPPLTGDILGASASQTYCYDATTNPSIDLGTNPAIGGSGNYSYKWESSIDDGANWTDVGVSTPEHSISGITQPTLYRREVSDNMCGTAYSDTIRVYLLPVVSATTTELCIGITAILSPRTNEGTWESSNPSVAEIIDNSIVKGKSTGAATLTYKLTATGCSAEVAVTVEDFPTVDEITGEKVVCPNNTIQLSNPTPNGVWTKNNDNVTFDNTAANPVTVTGVTEGKTFVTYTISNGICQTKRTYQLKIVSNKTPEIIIGIER
jgi:hypothetical protein